MTIAKLVLVATLTATLLVACGTLAPTATPLSTPTVMPQSTSTALPPPRATAKASPPPTLEVTLTTDSDHYEPSKAEIHVTLANHGDEAVYLSICGPWRIVRADTLAMFWTIECEIDYLGHKVEPDKSFSSSVSLYLDEGSYRVQTDVYGNCSLDDSQPISTKETYYGEFSDCAIREVISSEPFGAE